VVADVPGAAKADLTIRLIAATPKQPATLAISLAAPKDQAPTGTEGAADGNSSKRPEVLLRERRRAGAAADRRVPLPDDGGSVERLLGVGAVA
jgi:hypothetical protein